MILRTAPTHSKIPNDTQLKTVDIDKELEVLELELTKSTTHLTEFTNKLRTYTKANRIPFRIMITSKIISI